MQDLGNKQARHFFKEAINIDKAWAWPYVQLGFTHILDLFFGWSDSPLQSFEEAEKNAEKALTLNDSLDQVHSLWDHIYLLKRQHGKAIKEGERAIDLNPNGAEAHAQLGFILCCSGEIKLAIELLKRAFRLNPIPPTHFYYFLGTAYRISGRYKKAIELARKVLRGNPDQLEPYLLLAVSYSLLNRPKEAHKAVEEVLRINPNFSIKYFAKMLPYKHQETVDEIIDVLRKEGLPE